MTMPKKKLALPAKRGTLDPDAHRELIVMQHFLTQRDKAMDELLGMRLRRSRLRDEVIRLVVIEFGHDRAHHLSFYQTACAGLASSFAVRDEIRRLAGLEIVLMMPDPKDHRSVCIEPTQRLIDFYSEEMPRMVHSIRRSMDAISPRS